MVPALVWYDSAVAMERHITQIEQIRDDKLNVVGVHVNISSWNTINRNIIPMG